MQAQVGCMVANSKTQIKRYQTVVLAPYQVLLWQLGFHSSKILNFAVDRFDVGLSTCNKTTFQVHRSLPLKGVQNRALVERTRYDMYSTFFSATGCVTNRRNRPAITR